MNENLKKVLETIDKDETLAKKMEKCGSPEEAYELAQTVADGYTLEEFQEVMTKLRDIFSNSGEEEITEVDLNAVAGGLTDSEISGVVSASVTAGAGLALAAVVAW